MDNFKKFTVGCNYWASNAGTYMWRDWDEAVVDNDLLQLSRCGIDTIRVFPLWEDFQPIERFLGSERVEMRVKGKPLDKSPEGVAGVDPVMISRFERFVQLAQKHGIKLLVCLINGWMSGRMFFPPAFCNQNPITNKTAVKWEIRFVKYMVNRFKGCENIVAWEAGNETNVLCWVEKEKCSRDEYLVWLNTIVKTIKSEDNTRPVIAGMHGLDLNGFISPTDIGEICDVLTVHPYPAYVAHCFVDNLNSMKSRLHSTAESTYYSDLGEKPCLCEEIGTLGNMLGSQEVAADYLKANAYSLWANGNTGIMWWCGFGQTNLDFPPYDWCGLERELGLVELDGTYKPVAGVMKNMRQFVEDNKPLPPRTRHAVCVLTPDQDSWAVAYSSYILAKQAGFEIMFADSFYEIPKSNVYMLPALCNEAMPLRTQNELLRRVKEEGAVLYASWNDAFVSNLEGISGCKVMGNTERQSWAQVTVAELGETMPLYSKRNLELKPCEADVLAVDECGNPVLTSTRYGKGTIYFLGLSPELFLCDSSRAFECEEGRKYYKLYEYIFKKHTDCLVTAKSSPFVGITEHLLENGDCAVTAINYSQQAQKCTLELKQGYEFKAARHGNVCKTDVGSVELTLDVGEICIFEVKEQ